MALDLRYGGAMCGPEERDAIISAVDKAIATGNWQTGPEAEAMEKEAAEFLGVKHAVLTVSGSAAGLLALAALELPKGSEVIIPAVTFPTIFNIIPQCGLKPVVVDCEPGTYNIDLNKLEKSITNKTRAIIAVHAVGNPVDMPALMKLVEERNYAREKANEHLKTNYGKIYVIEDNCDGWGSSISGKRIGSFGDISITSFHAAHIVSMGVGGGVFTGDSELNSRVRMYRDWGRQANTTEPHKVKTLPADQNPRFVYDKIGYNLQILELQAAMGRVQLRKSDAIKQARKANFDYLVKELSKHRELIMPKTVEGADICWFALPLSTTGERAPLIAHLESAGIETRSMFSGNILKHPAYSGMRVKHGNLDGANWILEHSFWITVHPRLTQEAREYIVKTFDDYYSKKNT